MDLFFNSAHLRTLVKLKELADKHNCAINFGTRNSNSDEFDTSLLYECGVHKNIINKLEKDYDYNISISGARTDISEIWFELYDKNNDKKKYHTLSYSENRCSFYIEKNYDYDCSKDEKLDMWLDDNKSEYYVYGDKEYYSFYDAPTIIYGFKYKGKHRDARVYRPDMALKYFSDLVCDYLKEPRIVETY